MNFKLLDEPLPKLPIIGVLSLVIVLALAHLSSSVVDLAAYEMDRTAPTIETRPLPLPRPWRSSPQIRQVPQHDGGVCDDSCKQREQVFI